MKYFSVITLIVFMSYASGARAGKNVIEEASEAPSKNSTYTSENIVVSRLISAKNDVVYAAEAISSNESFQIYSLDEKIIIELMLANYKVRDGEPYYFMQEIDCPETRGLEVMKEWAANSKVKHLEVFASTYRDAKFVCTSIMRKISNVLSWLHSLVFTFSKNDTGINEKLRALAVSGLKLKEKPYFKYKEIVLP